MDIGRKSKPFSEFSDARIKRCKNLVFLSPFHAIASVVRRATNAVHISGTMKVQALKVPLSRTGADSTLSRTG